MNPHLALLDLDGTLYQGSELIDGATEMLDALRGRGHTLRFLTNTDSQSTEQMLTNLAARKLTVAEDELFASVTAAEALLPDAGQVTVLPITNGDVRVQLGTRFRLADGGAVAATHVVVGDVRDELSYPLLDTAIAALDGDARLIALQKGRFFFSGGRAHLDTGAVVAALEYAAGVADLPALLEAAVG